MDTAAGKFSLVVVSNRLPFVLQKTSDNSWERKSSAGGLVTAVAPVVIETGGSWVGWPGLPLSEFEGIPESSPDDVSPTAGLRSDRIVPVDLTAEDNELYYNGLCNETLWPVFHSMADRATFSNKAWDAYKRVNSKFAEKAILALEAQAQSDPDKTPIVWIQDYHLMLAAQEIRRIADDKRIPCVLAFFLHIPFPPFDMFKILPWEDEILEGMLGCDIIGMHDDDYCLNFLDCCQRGLGYRVDRKTKVVERNDGRFVNVKDMPISIPYGRFEELAKSAKTDLKSEEGVQIILGVDRLDYTKGLPDRLKAYQHLLEAYPQYRGKVKLMQVAVPSRTDVKEYKDLKEEMDKLVGSINGKFSTTAWTPIKYIYGSVPQSQLAGFYRDSDIALITPLRDGMNLVAKEFVACRVKEPGVLILSPFAGAGKHMDEALLVNPYEVENVAAALDKALKMPKNERSLRMNGLRAREKTHDVMHWMGLFMTTVQEFFQARDNLERQHNQQFEDHFSGMVETRKKFALLLDFDGTLTPLVSHPDLATLPAGTKDLLKKLKSRPDVEIAIISGRQVEDVRSKVEMDDITYSGSHGNVIEYSDGQIFEKKLDLEQIAKLKNKLEETVVSKYEGAWIEDKTHTLCVHIRQVRESEAEAAAEDITKVTIEMGLQPSPGHASVECKPKNTATKGTAVQQILENMYGDAWEKEVGVVYIGDDTTDEDAMKFLNGKGMSIRIFEGENKETFADMILKSTRSVVHFFHWFYAKLSSRDAAVIPENTEAKKNPSTIKMQSQN